MKKVSLILLVVLLLTGCGSVETWETLGDVPHDVPVGVQLRQVMLTLPSDAALEASVAENGMNVYICEDYWMVLQNFEAGDLNGTVKQLSGFVPAQLTMMESNCQDHARYDWVWTAASEEGEVVCRGALLDDGRNHYTLCVFALSEQAKQVQGQWNDLFASFCLDNQ